MLADIGVYDVLKFFFCIYIGYLLYFITDFLDKINQKLDRILEENRIQIIEPVKTDSNILTKQNKRKKVRKNKKRKGKKTR